MAKISVGAVKLSDKILYFGFDENFNHCFANLYTSELEVIDSDTLTAQCLTSHHFRSSVHIMVRGLGSWWGNACPQCETLTSALRPNDTFTSGDPAWSPWTKKQNAKYHVEPITGFSMNDWLDDYKTENKEEQHYGNEENNKKNGEFVRDKETGEIVRNPETGELARYQEGELTIDPQSGQIVRYDENTGKWKPENKSTTTPVGYVRGLSPDDVPF